MAEMLVGLTNKGVEYMSKQNLYNPDNRSLKTLLGNDLGDGAYMFLVAWIRSNGEHEFIWTLMPDEVEQIGLLE